MTSVEVQQILGVDKNNPAFSIYKMPGQNYLIVYFGACFLEMIPNDKKSLAYKMLLARLFNARIKSMELTKAFGVARSTLTRWGKAIKETDSTEVINQLSGPGFKRKITPLIEQYIVKRVKKIYPTNPYTYSKQIREDVAEAFDVHISSSGIRPYLAKAIHEIVAHSGDCVYDEEEGKSGQIEAKNAIILHQKGSYAGTNNRHYALQYYLNDGYELCHHAGMLLLMGLVKTDLMNKWGTTNLIVKQWLATILLGAVNIEQTKFLHFDSLDVLLGWTIRSLNTQRNYLEQCAQEVALQKQLFHFNGQLVSIENQTTFYYDPHVKAYAGKKSILKGWCPAAKGIHKAMNMDIIHTEDGHPVYIELADNFYDARERFSGVIERFREQVGLSLDRQYLFVLDRGFYKLELFQTLMSTAFGFVTWEKGFKTGVQDENKFCKSVILGRLKNHYSDVKSYRFRYIDQHWNRDERIRQLVVLATNPKGRTIEVSILSSDHTSSAINLIAYMFSRWIQENDYKYLDVHFGINEITSYKADEYETIDQEIQDKEMASGEYLALKKNRSEIQQELKALLLKREESSAAASIAKLQTKIDILKQDLLDVKKELLTVEKKSSRLERLIEAKVCRLQMANKLIMDILKLIARNLFYQALQPFRRSYNNFRDDHAIFRNLTRSLGAVSFSENQVNVILYPTVNYPPKIREIIKETLAHFNHTYPIMPDGSNRNIYFSLGQKFNKLIEPDASFKKRGYIN